MYKPLFDVLLFFLLKIKLELQNLTKTNKSKLTHVSFKRAPETRLTIFLIFSHMF